MDCVARLKKYMFKVVPFKYTILKYWWIKSWIFSTSFPQLKQYQNSRVDSTSQRHKYSWSSFLTQKLDRAMTKGFDNASDRSGLHSNGLRFRKEISQNFFLFCSFIPCWWENQRTLFWKREVKCKWIVILSLLLLLLTVCIFSVLKG